MPLKDPQAVPSFSSHPPPLSLPSTSLPRKDLENNEEISGGKRGTHVKREMWGILRESKLPEQKTEAERTASDHAADRPPKEGAERGWERRQRGPALDREARRAKGLVLGKGKNPGSPSDAGKIRKVENS